MFTAMNRFQVRPDRAEAFEAMWANRDSHLDTVPGFVRFNLLRGPQAADHVLYISRSEWADRAAFEAWTRSEAFRRAHRDAGSAGDMYLGPPVFEGFETAV
ncbi:MAG: antibiotic biosynthesis monooxygenase [Rhodobacteraceae bacterium]|jgi:heme-degrading monooxygenase HmoA|nr:antibiotic biosynthesis monooxygenase [Paracoccaceae bacterium]HBG99023.1 antibiotic biosynthesis monooxygenase [Paracoccaceae bacterium]